MTISDVQEKLHQIAQQTVQAIAHIKQAQRLNAEAQAKMVHGSPGWHGCETVDDKLHGALTLLGD